MSTQNFAEAVTAFIKQYPDLTSGDIQTFALGWQACQNNELKKDVNVQIPISPEHQEQITKNLIDKDFLAGEALELHEFLNSENVPKVKDYASQFPDDEGSDWVGIMPLMDRVIAYRNMQ